MNVRVWAFDLLYLGFNVAHIVCRKADSPVSDVASLLSLLFVVGMWACSGGLARSMRAVEVLWKGGNA